MGVVILFIGFGPHREAEPAGLSAVHMCMAMPTHPCCNVSTDAVQTPFLFCSCPANGLAVSLGGRMLEPWFWFSVLP